MSQCIRELTLNLGDRAGEGRNRLHGHSGKHRGLSACT